MCTSTQKQLSTTVPEQLSTIFKPFPDMHSCADSDTAPLKTWLNPWKLNLNFDGPFR